MIRQLLGRKGSGEELPQPLAPGTPAPDFSLLGSNGETVKLGDLRGKPAVLVFYPADASAVCSNQLALYNEALPLFQEHDAQIIGISVDDLASHKAFAESLNLRLPLLSDDDPAGSVAQAYGVYDERDGVCERALYVLDGEGIIRWSHVSPRKLNPGANGILEALDALAPENESDSEDRS